MADLRKAKVWFALGFLLLGALIATFVQTLIVVPGIWSAGATRALATAERSTSPMTLSGEDLKRLNRDIVSFQASQELLKLYLPLLAGLALTVVGGLGYYIIEAKHAAVQVSVKTDIGDLATKLRGEISGEFAKFDQRASEFRTENRETLRRVEARAEELIKDVKTDLKDFKLELTNYAKQAIDEAARAYQESRATYDRSKTELEQLRSEWQARFSRELEPILYQMAVTFWQNGRLDLAKQSCQKALEYLEKAASGYSTAEVNKLQQKMWSVKADLAYYCASAFVDQHELHDAEQALGLVRTFPEVFETAEFRAMAGKQPIALVDNYIFVVSRVQPLTSQDRRTWRKIFENYRDHIQDHLKRNLPPEEAAKILASYDEFARTLKGAES